ncbi:MAG: hypothetical protein JWO51_2749 [Rhodospirillales bacterium]|nr:hypothetical protein [Rhodospirillales bacterium]
MNDDAPFQPDRTLYERWRSHESGSADPTAELDPMILAAYLEGRLSEDDAAPLERLLAADPAALDDLLACDPVTPEISSAAFVARAQALVAGTTVVPFAPRAAAPRRIVTAWAAWGAVAASLVLISLVGFSLGMQTERNFNRSTGVGTSIDILDQSNGLGDGIG